MIRSTSKATKIKLLANSNVSNASINNLSNASINVSNASNHNVSNASINKTINNKSISK